MPKAALTTAAVIFAAVSVLHWVRYFLATEATIGGAVVPVSTSLIAGIVTAVLAAWMILASRKI
ncbi:MAG: hypothetical protein V3R79_05405 [Alphaproteobacteria bacterium]